jgi:hypothetical protein
MMHDGDFRRSTEGRYPTNSIVNVHTNLSHRSLPLPMPSLNPWRAERVPRQGHVRDDFRRAVRSAAVILGPKVRMGVILVKSGKPGGRFCRFGFARPLQGKLGTYLIAALPPRAAVDAVRCTIVRAVLLRSRPRTMLLRAQPVVRAPFNPIFTIDCVS